MKLSILNRGIGVVAGIVIASVSAPGCAISPPDTEDPNLDEASSALSGTDQLTQVRVRFETGGDDKRSDSHVWFHVTVNGFDNQFDAGGTGATWPNWTWTDYFYGNLPGGTHNSDISNFSVTWAQGGGGFNGDNWNMEAVEISVWDATLGSWQPKGTPGADPLRRFTGSAKSWAWGGWPL
jgi:hypothetical protein